MSATKYTVVSVAGESILGGTPDTQASRVLKECGFAQRNGRPFDQMHLEAYPGEVRIAVYFDPSRKGDNRKFRLVRAEEGKEVLLDEGKVFDFIPASEHAKASIIFANGKKLSQWEIRCLPWQDDKAEVSPNSDASIDGTAPATANQTSADSSMNVDEVPTHALETALPTQEPSVATTTPIPTTQGPIAADPCTPLQGNPAESLILEPAVTHLEATQQSLKQEIETPDRTPQPNAMLPTETTPSAQVCAGASGSGEKDEPISLKIPVARIRRFEHQPRQSFNSKKLKKRETGPQSDALKRFVSLRNLLQREKTRIEGRLRKIKAVLT